MLTDWDEDTPQSYGDERDYFMGCGCWSGQSDHTCQVGGWKRPDDCHCGAPDDCYCHESCDDPEMACNRHRAEHEQMVNDDHAEALVWNEALTWKGNAR